MRRTAGSILRWTGRCLGFVTLVVGLIYAVGCVVWLHAPPIAVLLATVAMMLPFLGLAWLLGKAGKRMSARVSLPWFEVDAASGRMHGTRAKKKSDDT